MDDLTESGKRYTDQQVRAAIAHALRTDPVGYSRADILAAGAQLGIQRDALETALEAIDANASEAAKRDIPVRRKRFAAIGAALGTLCAPTLHGVVTDFGYPGYSVMIIAAMLLLSGSLTRSTTPDDRALAALGRFESRNLSMWIGFTAAASAIGLAFRTSDLPTFAAACGIMWFITSALGGVVAWSSAWGSGVDSRHDAGPTGSWRTALARRLKAAIDTILDPDHTTATFRACRLTDPVKLTRVGG